MIEEKRTAKEFLHRKDKIKVKKGMEVSPYPTLTGSNTQPHQVYKEERPYASDWFN
jgi:hypothetical protein